MTDFRMVPRQGPIKASGIRYGFVIPHHPMGLSQTPQYNPNGFKAGDYVATWETQAIAEIAAFALGMPPSIVFPIPTYIPEAARDFGYD